MKAKEVLEKYGIHRNTLQNWVNNGKIEFEILPSGHKNYMPKNENKKEGKTIVYSRVSTTIQKENLERQTQRIKDFCSAKGFVVDEVFYDIASALNYNRKGYCKLYEMVVNKEVKRIVCEYKDRLLRIGYEEFERVCKMFGAEIIIIDRSEKDKSKQQEITEDLISIFHHFSMRIYSSRKRKQIIDIIKQ